MKLCVFLTTALLLGGVIGWFIGAYKPMLFPINDATMSRLEEFSQTAEALLNADAAQTYRNALEKLDQGDTPGAQQLLETELGHFYYSWTYEDEREMNSPIINSELAAIEKAAAISETFQRVIRFKPGD